MYKIKHDIRPEVIIKDFPKSTHAYNTRNRNIPKPQKHTTVICNRSFLTKANINFTRIPEDVKNAHSLPLFKKHFTRYKVALY